MAETERRGRSRLRRLTSDEIELWRQVARTIAPLPGSALPETPSLEAPNRAAPATPPQAPSPPPKATAEPYSPPRGAPQPPPSAPLERRLKQQLIRGRAPDAVLDLHGLRQEEAHRALRSFVHASHSRGARLVLVVTGKGRMSLHKEPHERDTGVLRRMTPHWLRAADIAPLIIGFEEAGPAHGGDGALYVRLRRADRVP